MKLKELNAICDETGEKIVAVRFVIADDADPDKRTEWIEGQVSTDIPAIRNHAILCSEVLEKARETLAQLTRDYRHLADQAMR